MKTLAIIVGTCLLMSGCGTLSRPTNAISRREAIGLAEKELARRHLRLPANYTVNVGNAIIDEEPGEVSVYQVDFSFKNREYADPVVVVSVNMQSGAIADFLDKRDYRPANMSIREFERTKNRD